MKLVIFLSDEGRKHLVEQEGPIEFTLEEFNQWDAKDLEVYGRVWAQVWPSDIVMLVEEK